MDAEAFVRGLSEEGAADGAAGTSRLSKAELRRRMRRLRSSASLSARCAEDALVERAVLALEAWRGANVVLPYLSFGSEVETRGLVRAAWREGRRVALPRVADPLRRTLEWHWADSLEGLVRSPMGMDEPPADPRTLVDVASLGGDALCVVPGLAFDRLGFRLGYGGGYYDAFLAGFPGASVGVCRDAQLVDSLGELGVLEAHDRPVGLVVSASGVIRGRNGAPASGAEPMP